MTIQPISELKNYNNLLDNVKDGSPIYLTKNGKGAFAILSISDADDFYKYQVGEQFKKDVKCNVEDKNFFIKDVEEFYNEIQEADRESMEKNVWHGDEIFDELKGDIHA